MGLLISSIPAARADGFSDMNGHWAAEAVTRWSDTYGVLKGSNGLFRPSDPVTRAELAVMLDRVMGYQTASAPIFADVTEDWYASAMLKLNAAGVLLGNGLELRPGDPVTRQEAAVLFSRAFHLEGEGSTLSYTDAGQVADWAASAVARLSDEGVLQGSNGLFRPADPVTRAEAATMLDRLVAALYTSAGTYTGDVKGTVVVRSDGVVLSDMVIDGDLILAPGATGQTVLTGVSVLGEIRDDSGFSYTTSEPETPDTTEPPPSEQEGPVTGDPDTIQFGTHVLSVLKDVPKNPYDPARFVQEGGVTTYLSDTLSVRQGIDVSAYQGNIDWQAVKDDGVDFAILRLGYRGYTVGSLNMDANFEQNINGAAQVGLPVGVYFFSQAVNEAEAVEEAEFVLAALEGYEVDYPVVFDWETVGSSNARTKNVDVDTLCRAAVAFCERIRAAGYQPMIYFNTYDGLMRYDLSQIKDYPFWLANYTETPDFYYGFQMWQYTSSGSVDGIVGKVDRNLYWVETP